MTGDRHDLVRSATGVSEVLARQLPQPVEVQAFALIIEHAAPLCPFAELGRAIEELLPSSYLCGSPVHWRLAGCEPWNVQLQLGYDSKSGPTWLQNAWPVS